MLKLDTPLHTVTFDCWDTLIFQPDPPASGARRAATLARMLVDARHPVSEESAANALDEGWARHYQTWRSGGSSGAPEIVDFALASLGVADQRLAAKIASTIQEIALTEEILVVDGAREALEWLAERGVRRALICDTGFTPGRVVRKLLERTGLRELLEALIFSDEVGVPKPHARMFYAALEALGSSAEGAVHVGDLRSTDIAGARAVGMNSVRLRWRHDDSEDLPDGDAVADSHAHLLEILGFRADDRSRRPG